MAFFIGMNLSNVCTFWFFKTYTNLPVSVLTLIAFGAGIIFALLFILVAKMKAPPSDAEARAAKKLEKKGLPVNFDSMMRNLNDIAGVRVICPYISDIYSVREMLLKQPDLKLIKECDYIENPKESGYRSLHLVMEIPVYLSKTEHHVRVEIQLRTIAMDFWASLEHQLHYKNDAEVPDSIRRELFRVAETIAMTDREMEEIAIELQALD